VDQSWNHRCCCHFHCNYSYTIWIFNIAMENGPFTDDVPIKTSIYHGFSIAMLNNQMVGVLQFWPEPLLCNEHFPMTYHWNSPTATCQTCQILIFVGHSMGPNMAQLDHKTYCWFDGWKFMVKSSGVPFSRLRPGSWVSFLSLASVRQYHHFP
jgi:hypothetical protein